MAPLAPTGRRLRRADDDYGYLARPTLGPLEEAEGSPAVAATDPRPADRRHLLVYLVAALNLRVSASTSERSCSLADATLLRCSWIPSQSS